MKGLASRFRTLRGYGDYQTHLAVISEGPPPLWSLAQTITRLATAATVSHTIVPWQARLFDQPPSLKKRKARQARRNKPNYSNS